MSRSPSARAFAWWLSSVLHPCSAFPFVRPVAVGFLAAVSLLAALPAQAQEKAEKIEYAIVIHGGAGGAGDRWSDEEKAAREKVLRAALTRGQTILAEGGTSLYAVEQVLRILEDSPLFNAGRGAVFNAAGGHELDASIMDGSNKACGAVAGVKTVKNPISLARLVMTRTRHVLLAADGADWFAEEMQVEQVANRYFSTPEMRSQWERARQKAKTPDPKDDARLRTPQRDASDSDSRITSYLGTVGCVALDRHGNLAAGTSTGGLTNKKYGRVGDSPIISAGTYADNATCGVSCTGIGEHFIRNAVAYDVSARMKYAGQSVTEAVRAVLTETLSPGDGGIIALSHTGEITAQFNTPGMARAAADSQGRFEVHVR